MGPLTNRSDLVQPTSGTAIRFRDTGVLESALQEAELLQPIEGAVERALSGEAPCFLPGSDLPCDPIAVKLVLPSHRQVYASSEDREFKGQETSPVFYA